MKPLEQQGHRPWPIPGGPWIMTQTWHDLLFAHWPVRPEALRPLLPAGLHLDTYDGSAWVGVVPFHMSGIRVRWLPPIPTTSRFAELNVRTYVTTGSKAGVWFFSLDAASFLAVEGARRLFHLPYFNAHMSVQLQGDCVTYSSRRTDNRARDAEFAGIYGPTGPVFHAESGSLEQWLTERYCLYSADAKGRLYRGEIHHHPWPLQPAEAEIGRNTMTTCHGIALPDRAPLLHFAKRLDVLVWPLARVS